MLRARHLLAKNSGGTPSPSGMAIGQNVGNLVYYMHSHPTVDILHGADFQVVGGTLDGQSFPVANRDANGNPNSMPSGATAISIAFQTPETSENYNLIWTVGGSGTGKPTILSGANGFTGLPTGSATSPLVVLPQAMAPGVGLNSFHYTLPGDGSWPVWTSCRPVADPGGTFSASFLAKLGALSTNSIRFLKWTMTEYNGGPTSGTTLKFPQTGDGQLAAPIITAANRNTSSAADWTLADGVPVETCIALATALGRDIFYPVNNQADGWNADGSPGIPTYYPAIASLFASFAQSTGHKVAIEIGNENWGGESDFLVNQYINEGNYRGQGADCHPAVVCVATSNITLSGTQTIDGVAVVAGNRVLVAGQTTASQNGVYVAASGAWSRAADTIVPADKWFISGGTSHGTQTWYVTTTGTITLGMTSLTIVQFERCARQAEKSAQMFAAFETAFNALGVGPANGASNKLVRALGWQSAGSTAAVQLMLNNPALQGHGPDAVHVAPYYDAVANGGIAQTYSGSTSGYATGLRQAIDTAAIPQLVTWKAFCDSKGLELMLYEMGPGTNLTNSTFISTWSTSSDNHDVVAYYLNEIRRNAPGIGPIHWLDFLDGTNGQVPTTNEDWGLLHQITDVIADGTHPKAQAVAEAIAGNYTMRDPTATNNGAGFGSPDGTAAVTFPGNGLLPEATFSINDPSGHFVLSTGFNATSGGSIKTVGTGITAGTYNVDFKQTYNGTTHTTTYPVVIAPAGTMDLNFGAGTYSVNGTGYALASIPGYSYTRANSLTVTDSTGAVATYAANTIPFANGVLHSYIGLSNLLSNPQDFSNASWNKTNITVTANTTVAPDGTTTADTANTSVINASNLWAGAGQTQGNPYTFSWYALRGTATDLKYSLRDTIHSVDIVAATSYYSQTNGSTFSRIVAPYTAGSSGTGCYVLRDSSSTGTCFLWQAQCLAGNFPEGGPLVTSATSTPTLSFTFPNGTYSVTYTFDDNSTQVVSQTVSGGVFTVQTAPTLNRGRIKSIVC